MAQAALVKNQCESVEKYGPYGNQSGQQWSMMLEKEERISEIFLRTGAVVDSITFVTAKPGPGGRWTESKKKFGGSGGNTDSKITLKCGEYITRISGALGTWERNREVAKLKFHTNLCPNGYGPYGGGPYTFDYSDFSSPVPSGGRVGGFFGTVDCNYIQSIGIYGQKKQAQGRKKQAQGGKKQYGPYGSQWPQNYNFQLEKDERISQVTVKHGHIVDAISFKIAKPDGSTRYVGFGGKGGGTSSTFDLRKDEYLTGVSGTFGYYANTEQRVIATLYIHTNFFPRGRGPYGTGSDISCPENFDSPMNEGCQMVGMFGRCENHMESIGVVVLEGS